MLFWGVGITKLLWFSSRKERNLKRFDRKPNVRSCFKEIVKLSVLHWLTEKCKHLSGEMWVYTALTQWYIYDQAAAVALCVDRCALCGCCTVFNLNVWADISLKQQTHLQSGAFISWLVVENWNRVERGIDCHFNSTSIVKIRLKLNCRSIQKSLRSH